jgi:competence protein ComEA
MTANRSGTPLTVLLVVIVAMGGILAWSRYRASQAAEIHLSQSPAGETITDEIYIGGAVPSPGYYPLSDEDSIAELLQAAGSPQTGPDSAIITLHVGEAGEKESPQKINLNRAEAWLLEALPGIGEERAEAIVSYRQEQGPFQNVQELVKVPGIGSGTFEEIKHLITVAD